MTDAGKIFTSKEMKDLANSLKANLTNAAPRMQSSNGICERAYQTIKTLLDILIKKNPNLEWNQLINLAVNTYNNTYHTVTGFAPQEILFGYKTTQIDKLIDQHISKNINIIENVNNRKNKSKIMPEPTPKSEKIPEFQIGDSVMIKDTSPTFSTKSKPRWNGPFKLLSPLGKSKLVWKLCNKSHQHIKNLKHFYQKLN